MRKNAGDKALEKIRSSEGKWKGSIGVFRRVGGECGKVGEWGVLGKRGKWNKSAGEGGKWEESGGEVRTVRD